MMQKQILDSLNTEHTPKCVNCAYSQLRKTAEASSDLFVSKQEWWYAEMETA